MNTNTTQLPGSMAGLTVYLHDYSTPLAKRTRKVTGPYRFTIPQPNDSGEGVSFYMDSRGVFYGMSEHGASLSLRLEPAKDLMPMHARLRLPDGYYYNDHGETMKPIVARLPHGRGFLAGYTMGDGMASGLDRTLWDSEEEAARAAHDLAESMAERQREYEEEENERLRAEEEGEGDPVDLDDFTRGYIEAALWSSTDEHGEPLDAVYSVDDIAPETLASMAEDCKAFQDTNGEDLAAYYEHRDPSAAGHDFWLTRNGHGAGFWDRGLGELGDRLSDAAKVYGGVDLYVGDDGNVHG